MLDVHCHLLFDVDDGAPDIETSVEMARLLAQAGFNRVAASPHFGEGPGGDVSRELADSRRAALATRLAAENIALELLPNAEHHITPDLFVRLAARRAVPLGGTGHWLLVELPWQGVPDTEAVMFRLQVLGYRLLLAHPERYNHLDFATCERLVERGVKMQLELGSFVNGYGKRSADRATELMENGMAHVLATDLHRPKQAEIWLAEALEVVRKRYGRDALRRGTDINPEAMVADASIDSIVALVEG